MESTTGQESINWSIKKIRKQFTAKRDDGPLHSAVRAGNLALVKEILMGLKDDELQEELLKQNQAGETALYVAAEYGSQDIVNEMIKYHDTKIAGIKARNGYDPLHIAAKHGDFGAVEGLPRTCHDSGLIKHDAITYCCISRSS